MPSPMTSLPPEAAGAVGREAGDPPAAWRHPSSAAPLPAAVPRVEGGARPPYGPRTLPPVRASDAPIELTLDLRATPPDKVIGRLVGALERISADVTLYVLLRDTPEYVGVAASAYQVLRSRGYFSDSSRMPQGGQRIRIQRRREPPRRVIAADEPEAAYTPPPAPERADLEERRPAAALDGAKVLPGERLSGWAVTTRPAGPTGPASPAGPAPAPGRAGPGDNAGSAATANVGSAATTNGAEMSSSAVERQR